MMMKIIALMALLSLAACGGSSSGGGSGDTAHSDGVACGQQVIDDYNDVARSCDMDGQSTKSDAEDCRNKGRWFLGNYSGINCRAMITNLSTGQQSEGNITEERVNNIFNVYTGGKRCSEVVTLEYLFVVLGSCLSLNSSSDETQCREDYESFLVHYPGVNCRIGEETEEEKESSYILEEDIQVIIDEIKSRGN